MTEKEYRDWLDEKMREIMDALKGDEKYFKATKINCDKDFKTFHIGEDDILFFEWLKDRKLLNPNYEFKDITKEEYDKLSNKILKDGIEAAIDKLIKKLEELKND